MRKRILTLALAVVLLAGGLSVGARALSPVAYATAQPVLVDGERVTFQCYALKDSKGNPTNYIKLRDVAYVLKGTAAQFSVDWDQTRKTISLTTGGVYQPNGSEMKTVFSGDQSYKKGTSAVYIDGKKVDMAAITLTSKSGGSFHYFKLRDMGKALGFQVDWSAEKNMIVVETGGRKEQVTIPQSLQYDLEYNSGGIKEQYRPRFTFYSDQRCEMLENGLSRMVVLYGTYTVTCIDGTRIIYCDLGRERTTSLTEVADGSWIYTGADIALTQRGNRFVAGEGTVTTTATSKTILDELSGKTFLHYSGVGAWDVTMTVEKNGGFTVDSHDSDMGEVGPGYPDGTVYFGCLSGRIGAVTKAGEFMYRAKIKNIENETLEAERIEDGIRYVDERLHGPVEGEDCYIYLPGQAMKDIPEDCADWISIRWSNVINNKAAIPFVVVYFPNSGYVFIDDEDIENAREIG